MGETLNQQNANEKSKMEQDGYFNVRLGGDLRFGAFLPFSTKIFGTLIRNNKNNNKVEIINITEKLIDIRNSKNHQERDQQQQQQQHNDESDDYVNFVNRIEANNSMVIDVTNYEVYRIITDAETKMELQKRLWLKICEHFGILNKLSLVTENFNVVDNIYIPAEYIPLSLSTSPPSLPSPSSPPSSPPSSSSSSSSPSAFIL